MALQGAVVLNLQAWFAANCPWSSVLRAFARSLAFTYVGEMTKSWRLG